MIYSIHLFPPILQFSHEYNILSHTMIFLKLQSIFYHSLFCNCWYNVKSILPLEIARARSPVAIQWQSQNSAQHLFLSLCVFPQQVLFFKVKQSPLAFLYFLVYPIESQDRIDALYTLAEMRIRQVEVFCFLFFPGRFQQGSLIGSFPNLANFRAHVIQRLHDCFRILTQKNRNR